MMKQQPENFSHEIESPRPLAWERKEPRFPCLDISLPRGKVASLEFDWQRHVFVTNHDVLFRPFFHKGIMDFEGARRMPSDGYEFLRALHDRLFLTGYSVTWKWGNPSRTTRGFE